jgi:hypothetical protein
MITDALYSKRAPASDENELRDFACFGKEK